MPDRLLPRMARDDASTHTECRTDHSHQISNYELFNCNNFNIRYWSWNYRGCWHQLALQLILDKGFELFSFQLPDLERPGIVIYCHYLSVSEVGNLRACCLPWMW